MRKYGIAWGSTVLIVSGLSIFAATQEWWTLSIALVHVGLVVSVIVILMSVRQLSHIIRTEDRKNKLAMASLAKNLTDSFETTGESQELISSSISDVQRNMEADRNVIVSIVKDVRTATSSLSQEVNALDTRLQKTLRSTADHVTKTTRHGTNEIESFIEVFSRFPATSWPMPSTGGWAIDAQGLRFLLALVEQRRPGRILELGSGTSTIWLGYLCRLYGGELITLDHLETYLDKTQTAVDLHELNDYIDCRLAPLQQIEIEGEQYPWYSTDSFSDLSDVDMVVVDGPPAATGPKARYPALPETISKLSSKVTIVLDDAHRSDESSIIEAWQAVYPSFTRLDIGFPGLAVLQRGY